MSVREVVLPNKTLVVLGVGPTGDLTPQIARGEQPRADFLEIAAIVGADIESYNLAKVRRGCLFTRVFQNKPRLGSVFSAFSSRGQYSRIYATGEDIGLPLAILLRLFRWPGRLTLIVHKSFTRKRKILFALAGRRVINSYVCVSQAQAKTLTDWGVDERKIVRIRHSVDERFFAPLTSGKADDGYVFSCGSEKRDYATLAAAAEKFPHKIRVTASGWNELTGARQAGTHAPAGGENSRLSFEELRAAYDAARFVVVPLEDVGYAAGSTGILEAMAMGKALIVTSSRGLEGYVIPGVSAITVPSQDPEQLLAAMLLLWDAPDLCARMGAHNRAWVEREFSIRDYCQRNAELLTG